MDCYIFHKNYISTSYYIMYSYTTVSLLFLLYLLRNMTLIVASIRLYFKNSLLVYTFFRKNAK